MLRGAQIRQGVAKIQETFVDAWEQQFLSYDVIQNEIIFRSIID